MWAGGSIPPGIPRHSVNSPPAKGLLIPVHLLFQRRSEEPDPPHLLHINEDRHNEGASAAGVPQPEPFSTRGFAQPCRDVAHQCQEQAQTPLLPSPPGDTATASSFSCSGDLGKVVFAACESKELHKLFARPRLSPKSQSHPPLPKVRDAQLRVCSPGCSVMLWEPEFLIGKPTAPQVCQGS